MYTKNEIQATFLGKERDMYISNEIQAMFLGKEKIVKRVCKVRFSEIGANTHIEKRLSIVVLLND